MLSRKEISAAYGKIETKFKRLKRDLAAAGIEPEALASISETLDAQQLQQVKKLHDEPVKEVKPATY